MFGYFKVSIPASQAIAVQGSPELLGAYVVLAWASYGTGRGTTAAGAQAIAKYTGCTDYRSKNLLSELESLRFGERGERGLFNPTGNRLGRAKVRQLCEWPGEYAYLPSTFVHLPDRMPAPLKKLCGLGDDPEKARDALLLMLKCYAGIDYGAALGLSGNAFFHQVWRTEGVYEHDAFYIDLGLQTRIKDTEIWAVSLPEDDRWLAPENTTSSEWEAFWLLLNNRMLCKVAVVSFGRKTYPLWVFDPGMRRSLLENNLIYGGLAKDIDYLARHCGMDPDNRIAATAAQRDDPHGTGVYFCLADGRPRVRTLLVPRWHAPTPINLDGLREQAKITKEWTHKAKQLSLRAA